MKKLLFSTIVLLIILSCNKTASATSSADDEIVARWRGGQITLNEFEDFALETFFKYDSVKAGKSTTENKKEILDFMINSRMIRQIADSLQIDTTKTIREAYKRRLYRNAYNFTLFMDSVQNKIVTEDEVRKQYNMMKHKYNISHILFENKDESDKVYKELKSGSGNFHDLAVKYSKDESSKINGGNMGWNTLTGFVDEFSENVYSVKKGDITKPFKTKYGWHIALLHDKMKNNGLGTIEAEKQNIRYRILSKTKNIFDSINNDFESWLLKKYKVFIDSGKVRDFVEYFNSLYKDDTKKASDLSYYKLDIALSAFDNDTVYVKDVISALKNSIEASSDLNKDIPEVTGESVYKMIFHNHIYKIRPLISDELGYTKRSDIIELVKQGMTADYREYLIDNYIGSKEQEMKWIAPYREYYNLSIDNSVFEKALYMPSDDKK